MTTPADRHESNALNMLAAQAERLPGDYLIVGPYASYAYHQWLSPIEKLIHLRIRAGDLERWQAALAPPWLTISRIPTHEDVISAVRVAALDAALTDNLHSRRRVIDGLTYPSPEDWCAELLARADAQGSISEVTAIMIAQREKLDWNYFLGRVVEQKTLPWLKAIIEMVNLEIGREYLSPMPLRVLEGLSPSQSQPEIYFTTPRGRRRLNNRPLISRQIIGKVVLDLEYHWRERERVAIA